MIRKSYISFLLLIALFAVGNVAIFAQGGKTIGGKVEFEDEKGKKTLRQGIRIDCYRVDVNEKCGSVVTDEKGVFAFEEVPKEAVVVVALSGEGILSAVVADVSLDDQNFFVVKTGESIVPTEDAVRIAAIEYGKEKNKLTDAQKAQLAEFEKKIAERDAKVERSKENNKLRIQYLKEGNEAFNDKNYDLAIEKFTLGYELDPEFLGGAPVFLNNKAESLRIRAVDNYNTAVKAKDAAAIRQAKVAATKDFMEALNATTMSYEMATKSSPDKNASAKKLKDDAKSAKDIIKKVYNVMGQMNLNLASNLTTEADATKAVSIYQTSLTILPDDPDILAGLALALYSAGDFKGSMAEKKESLEYWNKYKKVAPKDHKQQVVADGMIEFLKGEVSQN